VLPHLMPHKFFNANSDKPSKLFSSQIFCLFLFLFAASLFGTIVAQVNEIVAQLTTKKKGLDLILQAYLVIHPRWVLQQYSQYATEHHLCHCFK
jgi:hypothetical protein